MVGSILKSAITQSAARAKEVACVPEDQAAEHERQQNHWYACPEGKRVIVCGVDRPEMLAIVERAAHRGLRRSRIGRGRADEQEGQRGPLLRQWRVLVV
jgi:hypothetical protein